MDDRESVEAWQGQRPVGIDLAEGTSRPTLFGSEAKTIGFQNGTGGAEVQVRVLSMDDDQLLRSAETGLFDQEIQPDLVSEFLGDPRHHLIAAIDEGVVVGFVSAVDYVHPDKAAELWINEVAVAPEYRGRGIGGQLMAEALALADRLNCHQAWVLARAENRAARALYASVGGTPSAFLMYEFRRSGQTESPTANVP
ncbi:MAG: GNAT family N-acetyltransferase [Anaerolineales bacterium]